ncbi:MAG: hypothetical protein OXG37_06915 [Actinomycetia bacterium]|nr:hypothetical protein [Actinomycetes bacterium]
MSDAALSEREGPIRTVTLNRPERLNAMNPELVGALADRLAEANAAPRPVQSS